jgi:hypothetical protein
MGPLAKLLHDDHRRLEALLDRAETDANAYREFREGLLRHIAMEEKVLLPAAKRLRGGDALPIADQLRLDHSAIAALLVPTPTSAILQQLRTILKLHNPLEEGEIGLYAECERLAHDEIDALLERVRAVPPVKVAKHFDGPRAFAAIEDLVSAAQAARKKQRS